MATAGAAVAAAVIRGNRTRPRRPDIHRRRVRHRDACRGRARHKRPREGDGGDPRGGARRGRRRRRQRERDGGPGQDGARVSDPRRDAGRRRSRRPCPPRRSSGSCSPPGAVAPERAGGGGEPHDGGEGSPAALATVETKLGAIVEERDEAKKDLSGGRARWRQMRRSATALAAKKLEAAYKETKSVREELDAAKKSWSASGCPNRSSRRRRA